MGCVWVEVILTRQSQINKLEQTLTNSPRDQNKNIYPQQQQPISPAHFLLISLSLSHTKKNTHTMLISKHTLSTINHHYGSNFHSPTPKTKNPYKNSFTFPNTISTRERRYICRNSMNNESLINGISAEEVVLNEEGGKKRKVKCEVEVISWRERRVKSQVEVDADVESVWTALTDYERLADFIPNLIFRYSNIFLLHTSYYY